MFGKKCLICGTICLLDDLTDNIACSDCVLSGLYENGVVKK